MKALRYIEIFSTEIGVRGSGGPGERKAHQKCFELLSGFGYSPTIDTFTSIASAYRPFILATAILLFSYFSFYFWAIQIPAIFLAIFATVSAYLEIGFFASPLRLVFPRKKSQNVYAIQPAKNKASRTIVLMAHVDSHRTPLIWRSRQTYKLYRFLSIAGLVAFPFFCLILIIETWVSNPALFPIATSQIIFVALIFFMTLQAELTPFTHGANDNASGVAAVLEIAENLKQSPLENCEVWFVFTGCEEVGAHGSFAFLKKHKNELQNACFIAVDNIAGRDAAPCYYLSETMLRPVKFSQRLIEFAQETAAENPELGARSFEQQGAYTDATPPTLAGLPAIAVVGHREDGWIPNWHNPDDTFENISEEALAKAQNFVAKLIAKIDSNSASKILEQENR